MDPARFDHWTGALVGPTPSRRRLLAALAGGLAAAPVLVAQGKQHHKKPCTGGAVRCGRDCCAADDHCVQKRCYCAAGARTAAAANCSPWTTCASRRDIDAPCSYGDLGPCFCQRTVDAAFVCVSLDAPDCGCAQDADCPDGYVCVPGVEGCGGGNACVPTGAPFC